MSEIKFAGTTISIDGQVVAKVTSFSREVTISEDDITGAEDIILGTDILHQKFTAIAVSETAKIEGIAIEDAIGLDVGQSELKNAAESGDEVTITQTKNTGTGHSLTGFFTAYSEEGSTSGVYKFSGTFRVNEKTDIMPGS